MGEQKQVVARIDVSVKKQLDAYAREHGVKRDHLIEQALRYYLRREPSIAGELDPEDYNAPARP